MKDMLYFVLRIFSTVTTCIVCIIGILSAFSESVTVPAAFLWQIPVVAALTSLPSLLYYLYKIPLSVRFALHYVIVFVTVFLSGFVFEWFTFNTVGDYLTLWIEITSVYAVAFIVGYTSKKKQSEELNRALKSKKEIKQ